MEQKKGKKQQEYHMSSISNAVLRALRPNKSEIKFPKDGTMKIGRYDFRDQDDISTYISRLFSTENNPKGVHGSIKRIGRYQRVDNKGKPVFTFGDPILDSITDENGIVILSGQRLNLRAVELSEPDQRGGGVSTIDFTPFAKDIAQHQIIGAAQGNGNLTIVECNEQRIIIASSNPHVIWNYDPTNMSIKMRFRAFMKSYGIYWKAGADIETWGRDFTRASIVSRYGYFIGNLCIAECQDSDSDTNDDYVDEYEWGYGFGVSGSPDGVRSFCTAVWGNQVYSSPVEKGCIVVDLGNTQPC